MVTQKTQVEMVTDLGCYLEEIVEFIRHDEVAKKGGLSARTLLSHKDYINQYAHEIEKAIATSDEKKLKTYTAKKEWVVGEIEKVLNWLAGTSEVSAESRSFVRARIDIMRTNNMDDLTAVKHREVGSYIPTEPVLINLLETGRKAEEAVAKNNENFAAVFHKEILGIAENYKSTDALWEIISDKQRREAAFRKFLNVFGSDVSEDKFRLYFESEHADRKTKKQDFTPPMVVDLMNKLAGKTNIGGVFYEVCAGTGGIVVNNWWQNMTQHDVFEYKPSYYFYVAEDLSERVIPFLIFNMALRGMNGLVVHCDTLTRETYGAWSIQNVSDNHMGFSDVHRLPYNESTEQYLSEILTGDPKFVDKKYGLVDEVPDTIPQHLAQSLGEYFDAVDEAKAAATL